MWRGPALADFTYAPFAQAEIARLDELRLDAFEERVEAELALGSAADLVAELEHVIRDNPLRERLRGQLMLALYRSGRQADALDVYRQTRETLDEELGLVPSPPLQRLQAAILRQEPALEVSIEPPAEPSAPLAPGPVPHKAVTASTEVRKTVTVLIARQISVRGRDPEALSTEEERYRAQLALTVERYGGTITSSRGNQVMAVFGVPGSTRTTRSGPSLLRSRLVTRWPAMRPTRGRTPASQSRQARFWRAAPARARCRSLVNP